MSPVWLRIRELRDAKRLSQQALGELAGVRQATISELESGKAKRMDFQTLDRLAEALGVEPAELVVRDRKRRRHS